MSHTRTALPITVDTPSDVGWSLSELEHIHVLTVNRSHITHTQEVLRHLPVGSVGPHLQVLHGRKAHARFTALSGSHGFRLPISCRQEGGQEQTSTTQPPRERGVCHKNILSSETPHGQGSLCRTMSPHCGLPVGAVTSNVTENQTEPAALHFV